MSLDRGAGLPGAPARRVAPRGSGRRAVVLAACLALALSSERAGAHDFWIEPSTFRPAVDGPVTLRLRVGEHLEGVPVPRDESMVQRFFAAGPGGARVPVAGADGAEPAGIVSLPAPGRWTVAYEGRASAVELAPGAFAAYLDAEGLDRITDLRRARGEQHRTARELFLRCAKAIVVAGDTAGATPSHDRGSDVLGLTLELVALERARDASHPFRLLYEGRPLAGALVTALGEREPQAPLSARTDADGRVSLPLAAGGAWLVKAVHMVEAPPGSGADYQSFWASLTFVLADVR